MLLGQQKGDWSGWEKGSQRWTGLEWWLGKKALLRMQDLKNEKEPAIERERDQQEQRQ